MAPPTERLSLVKTQHFSPAMPAAHTAPTHRVRGTPAREATFPGAYIKTVVKNTSKVGLIIGVIGFVFGFFWLTKIFPF